MARTFPTAGLAPTDVYLSGENTNRGAAYFERYHDTTGGSYANCVTIRQQVNTTVTYPTALYVRNQVDASGSIGSMYGIWINTASVDSSSTVSNLYDVSITHTASAVPSYEALFRLYNGATSATPAIDSVFHLANSGGTPFTNLFDFEGQVIPVSAQATALSGVTTSHKIACLVGATTVYIPLITSWS